jgi:hypothetical protein
LPNKYSAFERLWGERNFNRTRYKSKEEIGKVRGEDEILNLFK